MSNKQPTILMSLRADDNGNVIDCVKENHWINDLGVKTKTNKNESPFGNPNGCIEFAGGNDRLKLDITNPAFDMKNKDWTLSFWIKYSNLTTNFIGQNKWQSAFAYQDFWSGKVNNVCHFWLNMYSENSAGALGGVVPSIHYDPPNHDEYSHENNMNFDAAQWNHIAFVQKSGTAYFLCNGKLIWKFSHPNINLIGFSINDGAPLCLGRADDGTGCHHIYQGYIDDFTIINNCALWTTDYKVPTDYLARRKSIYLDSHNSAWAIS